MMRLYGKYSGNVHAALHKTTDLREEGHCLWVHLTLKLSSSA